MLEKQGRAHKCCTPMDPFTWTSKDVDTGCSPEDLAEAMNHMGGAKRGSGTSMLMARQDDDDDDDAIRERLV